MSIDWSKAPSSATHYLPEQKDLGWEACWYKKDGDKWLVMNCARLEKRCHMEWVVDYSEVDKFVPLLVPRSAFSSEWNGQGLPPVGTVCEVLWSESRLEYLKAKVFGVNEHGQPIFRFEEGPKKFEYQADPLRTASGTQVFRPVRTLEQIAAEEREAGISDMQTITDGAGPTVYAKLSALYDAGYRRQESST
ncbi:hypothetical protein [Pseudomonas aeruginosa]|uniref:hypothetical protein n=1 Tax=Pseudomonas aeruginosa TaxID=287 RepID=UPI0012985F8A|nr:hypothetical protein [Pseudomonas aeruginosa]HCG1294855.1 hypothetical protein [Pseudomonas aeruginosa]